MVMDWADLLGKIGLLAIVVAVILTIAPLMGEMMYIIVCDWFGHDINKELFWTGITLIAVFRIVTYSGKDD